MSFALDDLTRQMVRVEQTVTSLLMAPARPVALRALGWQMTHLGERLKDEAARRQRRVGVPVRAEEGADGLSTDATRNPDLTYGDAK